MSDPCAISLLHGNGDVRAWGLHVHEGTTPLFSVWAANPLTRKEGCMIELELPFPSRTLHPNARVHWRTLAAAKHAYRNWGRMVGYLAKAKLRPPVEAEVTFIVPDRRRRDEDGLLSSLKSAWDGLVDSGLLEDDRTGMLTVTKTTLAVEKGRRAVVVRLRSVAPAGEALSVSRTEGMDRDV